MIQRVYLDFGGCIDAPGIHTRTLFWDAFLAERTPATRESFQEAYTKADQQMMSTGEAKSFGLKQFNRWNALLIAKQLGLDETSSAHAGDRVTDLMDSYIKSSATALRDLKRSLSLSVISNFTGNLEVIMREYAIRDLFDSVTESFYVGASKPEEKIFREALAKHNEAPSTCIYVGDNPVNDIAPAKALGMKAALIHLPGAKKECAADYYLTNLGDLLSLIQSR